LAFQFITEDDLLDGFNDAVKYNTPLHEHFDEFERIARNKPHPKIDKSLPRVTDGTLAALIQDQPKRVIQQIPTGQIIKSSPWLNLVGSYILESEILPNSEQIADLIQKCWALTSKALTYGSQPVFVQFVNRGDYFGTDWSLPYIKDILLEPGKLSDRDSNTMYLRTWWSKGDIEATIYKEQQLTKMAKDRGEKYQSDWNLERLAALKEQSQAKDPKSQTPKEKETADGVGFVEIVHVFQRGIGANFYSFSPKLPAGDNVVRTRVNKDPRGFIPIHFMYSTLDFSNPLGRGVVELSGGMQNLLDSQVQMYQYTSALLLNPPMVKKGDWSSSQAKYAPNALIDLGTDENADFKPLDINTSAIDRFPENYGLMRSQILNLNSGGGDTQTSATVGNPGFSKTDAGVNVLQEKLGFSDNYIRKQFEACFAQVLETQINLYFAERSGVQELKLDEETAAKLEKIAPGSVNADMTIRIDYDTETPKLKFQIDASSSMQKDNAEQLERAQNLLEIVGQFPQFDSKNGGDLDTTELLDRIVSSIGLEDPEKLIVRKEDGQQNQPTGVTPEQVQQMIAQAVDQLKQANEKPLSESLGIKFEKLPEDVQMALIKQIFNIDPQGPTPTSQELELKAAELAHKLIQTKNQTDQAANQADQVDKQHTADTAVKLAELDHKQTVNDRAHTVAASAEALKVAQAEHSQAAGNRDHQFKVNEATKQDNQVGAAV
jgi:hypothetical protein